jgi:hypothetical protein
VSFRFRVYGLGTLLRFRYTTAQPIIDCVLQVNKPYTLNPKPMINCVLQVTRVDPSLEKHAFCLLSHLFVAGQECLCRKAVPLSGTVYRSTSSSQMILTCHRVGEGFRV